MQWSKSKLNTMRQCPLKFKFSYIDLLPQPEAHIDLKKGSILHEAFDKFYENLESNYFFEIVQKELEKQNVPEGFVEKYGNHIMNFVMFNNLQKRKYGDAFIPYQRETHYEYANIHGIIDRIDCINGKYYLIDYKTSTGNDIEGYEDELIFYAYLFQQNTGKKIDGIGIFFTGNQIQPIIKDINQEYIQITMDAIFKEIEMYEKLMETPEGLKPKKSFACKWCPYKKECPLWNK